MLVANSVIKLWQKRHGLHYLTSLSDFKNHYRAFSTPIGRTCFKLIFWKICSKPKKLTILWFTLVWKRDRLFIRPICWLKLHTKYSIYFGFTLIHSSRDSDWIFFQVSIQFVLIIFLLIKFRLSSNYMVQYYQ